MTDPDLDKVVETIKRHSDGGLASLGLIGPAYGSAAGMGNPYAPTGGAVQAVRNAACEAQNLNMANAALARRGTVTMNKPLEPWGHTAFHKFLAIHIHNATRLAGDTDGIVDDVLVAQKWDLPRVVE